MRRGVTPIQLLVSIGVGGDAFLAALQYTAPGLTCASDAELRMVLRYPVPMSLPSAVQHRAQ